MRKVLVLFSALIGVGLLATAVRADPILYPRVPADWNTASGGQGIGLNEPAPAGWEHLKLNSLLEVGDEDRTVFNVEEFTIAGKTYSFPDYGSLTGLAYDLQVVSEGISGGNLIIYLGNSTRRTNPIAPASMPADTSGAWVVYENSPSTRSGSMENLFNPGGTGNGPQQWVQGNGTVGSFDTYPGAGTVGQTPWLYGSFLDSTDAMGNLLTVGGVPYVAEEVISVATGAGSLVTTYDGIALAGLELEVVGGLPAPLAVFGGNGNLVNFNPEVYGPPDLLGQYDNTPPDDGGWALASNDAFGFKAGAGSVTVDGVTITTTAGQNVKGHTDDASSLYAPEPVSMIFFGTGLVAIGGYVARRRMLGKA